MESMKSGQTLKEIDREAWVDPPPPMIKFKPWLRYNPSFLFFSSSVHHANSKEANWPQSGTEDRTSLEAKSMRSMVK